MQWVLCTAILLYRQALSSFISDFGANNSGSLKCLFGKLIKQPAVFCLSPISNFVKTDSFGSQWNESTTNFPCVQ